MTESNYSTVTPELMELAGKTAQAAEVAPELYTEYGVKRGLRDVNGKGVLVGITNISEVTSTRIINGVSTPIDGELYYRGYNVQELIRNYDAVACAEAFRNVAGKVKPLFNKDGWVFAVFFCL